LPVILCSLDIYLFTFTGERKTSRTGQIGVKKFLETKKNEINNQEGIFLTENRCGFMPYKQGTAGYNRLVTNHRQKNTWKI
jgi:hypothetical protein